jgi:hypothetical protein
LERIRENAMAYAGAEYYITSMNAKNETIKR